MGTRKPKISGGNGSEDDGLNREAGTEPEHCAPLAPFSSGVGADGSGALPHLVQHEEHGTAGHVAEFGQHLSRRLQLVAAQLELDFHLVQDRRPPGVHRPEHVVPGGGRQAHRLDRLRQDALDVLGDEFGHVPEEVEDEAGLSEVAFDGAVAPRQHHGSGVVQLEEGPLQGQRVGADDHGSGAVPEQRRAHQPVQVVFVGSSVHRQAASHARPGGRRRVRTSVNPCL